MTCIGNRKWPDGLCTSSVGITQTKISTINSSSRLLRVVFFPGRQNWLLVQSFDGTVLACHGDDHDVFTVTKQFVQNPTNTAGEFAFAVNYDNTSPNNWRPVSYGLHICTSPQTDAGWYTAKRIPTADMDYSVVVNNNILLPDMTAEEYSKSYYSSSRIRIKAMDIFPLESPNIGHFNNRGTVAGPVKELNNATFVLNPVTKRNEFSKNRTVFLRYPENYSAINNISCRTYNNKTPKPENEQSFVLSNLVLFSNKYYIDINGLPQDLISTDPDFTRETLLQTAFDTIVVYLFPDGDTLFTITTKVHQELLYKDNNGFRRNYTPAWYAYPPIMNSYLSYVSSFFKTPYIITTIEPDNLKDSHSSYFS